MELDRSQLLNAYERIKDNAKKVDEIKKDIANDVLQYRVASVSRVLNFIHTSIAINRSIDLATLITHCCNKLNGNIDGIELELEGE